MSTDETLAEDERLPTDVKSILERHPSRPWTADNLNHLLQELTATGIAGDDSDSSIDGSTLDDSELDILQGYRVFGSELRSSRISKGIIDSHQITRAKKAPKAGKEARTSRDQRGSQALDLNRGKPGNESQQKIKNDKAALSEDLSLKAKKPPMGSDTKVRTTSFSHDIQATSLRVRDSEMIDLGKISSRLLRKPKCEPESEYLSDKIAPRVTEMVNAIKTGLKYNLQPENITDEDELESKIELNRLLKSYRSELSTFGINESRTQYNGPSIKGIPSFRYKPLQPKKKREKPEACRCLTCKVDSVWLETKRKKADDLAAFLGESRKAEHEKVWHCQCKGPRPGFNNRNQMIMKIPVPQSMRPDELKKLNSVPRMEIYKHITPAESKENIKNAVLWKPQPARPIIQQEMMCHTNEMRCVQLPSPFTGKVTKAETPDWVVEYNKRYIYDYFFLQSKNIPNVPFLHFSYKKNMAVLIEEIIQGCMNRTDVFDDDTCQCTFLCTCAHKTVRKPNATLFDTVRQAKRYCAADLHEGNIYEAGDYVKSGDKTYFICSKLCNTRMKLHKQLHI